MNKKNWIRGFDRIAILLAIPIAVLGFLYSSKKYSEKKAMNVYYIEEDAQKEEKFYKAFPEEKKKDTFLIGSRYIDGPKGILADGKNELKRSSDQCMQLKFALERAAKAGGDPNGTLVNKKTFGIGNKEYGLCLMPRKSKRYAVGACGAIGFAFLTILSIGLSTRGIPRIVKWIKEGFKDD